MSWKQPISTSIYEDFGSDHLARDLYIHLLLRSCNKDMEAPAFSEWRKPYQLKRGQTVFGRSKYGDLLRSSPKGVERCLHRLRDVYKKVTCTSTKDYTIVTILNYDDESQFDQASAKRVPSKCQASATSKSVKSDKSVKNNNNKEINNLEESSELHQSYEYLRAVPDEDLRSLVERYGVGSEAIKRKAEGLYLWTQETGRVKKNYRVFLQRIIAQEAETLRGKGGKNGTKSISHDDHF